MPKQVKKPPPLAPIPEYMPINPITRWILIALGSLAVCLGIIGIFLPVMPTTVFFILAAFCYMRSSERLFVWLTRHKHFGPPVNAYLAHRAIPLKVKIFAVMMVWLSAILVSVFVVHLWFVQLILVAVAVFVTVFMIRSKTLEALELGNDRESSIL